MEGACGGIGEVLSGLQEEDEGEVEGGEAFEVRTKSQIPNHKQTSNLKTQARNERPCSLNLKNCLGFEAWDLGFVPELPIDSCYSNPMMPDIYRSCASVVVLRPSDVCSPDGCGTIYQVLLLHKPRKKDDWQLPQGGVDPGETHEQAAMRELKEESGMDAEIIGKSGRVYQYDFPPSYRRFRPDDVCGQRLEFFFAQVQPNQEVIVDQSEINEFAWTTKEEISNYVKRKEYCELIEELVEEGIKLLRTSGLN